MAQKWLKKVAGISLVELHEGKRDSRSRKSLARFFGTEPFLSPGNGGFSAKSSAEMERRHGTGIALEGITPALNPSPSAEPGLFEKRNRLTEAVRTAILLLQTAYVSIH